MPLKKETPLEEREPCIGLCVMATEHGPRTPVIIRVKDGELIFDPPGGKPDPGETREQALQREYGEEAGTRILTGNFIGSLPHPVKEGLERHFFEASHVKGSPTNKVPKEHEALLMTDVENAIALFGDRIPLAGMEYLRSEAERIERLNASNILHLSLVR